MTWIAVQQRVGVTPDGVPGPATLAGVMRALGMDQRGSKALSDEGSFFAAVRGPLFRGTLKTEQVEGLQALCAAMGAAGWCVGWAAYGLATAYHETAYTMQPVREAYWLTETWRKSNLRYWPHYGRGYVQITWPANYERADAALDLGGTLVRDLDRAIEPEIAARILVRGMEEGWFAADGRGRHTLARHIPDEDGELAQFKAARRIINGTDKAAEIAAYAVRFQSALKQGMWA